MHPDLLKWPTEVLNQGVRHICADKGVAADLVEDVLMYSARCFSPGKALDLSYDPKSASALAMKTEEEWEGEIQKLHSALVLGGHI